MIRANYKKGAGAVLGIIIIIIVLLIGAIYFLGQTTTTENPSGTSMQQAGASDEVSALQADAAGMNFDNLGQGVDELQ